MKTQKKLQDLDYNFELEKAAAEIKKQKAKKVLIQLPEGFKPYALQIVEELKNQTKNSAEFFIWMDSCYGACDIPIAESEKLGIDLIIQFGHSAWNFEKEQGIKILK